MCKSENSLVNVSENSLFAIIITVIMATVYYMIAILIHSLYGLCHLIHIALWGSTY